MTAHLDQAYPKWKYSRMACRACVQLPWDANEIDAIINNKIMNTTYDMIVHLETLDNGRKLDIGTLKK